MQCTLSDKNKRVRVLKLDRIFCCFSNCLILVHVFVSYLFQREWMKCWPPTLTAARQWPVLRELSCYRSSTMTTARWIYVLTTGGPAVSCHQRLGRPAGTVHGQGSRTVVITRQSAKDRIPRREGSAAAAAAAAAAVAIDVGSEKT